MSGETAGVSQGFQVEPEVPFFLPRACYVDDRYFRRESELIFGGGWVGVGFAADVANPGSVAPVEVCGRALFLARDRDGALRVFENVCPHRGFPLVARCEAVNAIRCQYHRWSFELSGSSVSAPFYDRQIQSVRSGEHPLPGLFEIRHGVWGGVVFADLSESAPPFGEWIAPLAKRLEAYGLDVAERFTTFDYEVDANWKLVVENYLDYYHLPFVHRQLGGGDACCLVEEVPLSEDIFGGTYPSGALDKKPKMLSPLPAFPGLRAGALGSQDIFCVFPNVLVFVEPNWFQAILLDPKRPGVTLERFALFASPEGMGGQYEASRIEVGSASREINDQDIDILVPLQNSKANLAAGRPIGAPYWDQTCSTFLKRVSTSV
jgi:choline monooxygenase